jgi:glycosyltransferase involved in cell wall biosynthesis
MADLMRCLPRTAYEVHAGCAAGTGQVPTPTFEAFSRVPDVRIHPVHLGPELSGLTGRDRALAALQTLNAVPDLCRLASVLRRHRIDIIHSNDRPRDAAAAILLARITGIKCVLHVHVAYGEWMSPLRKWSLKRADALIAVSSFVKDSLVASGHHGASIQVALNGIDPHKWKLTEGRDDVRRELAIPKDAPLVLSVCRLFPAKGPADLIRVLPAIRAVHPDVRLLIVGQEMVPGYQRELSSLAEELRVQDHVVFAGWRNDVPQLMEAADVFAMPSLGEPYGLVYVEAMAMELPVVALRHGGTPEVVEDGVTGLLSEPGDLPRLTEHLLLLLETPAVRHEMGRRGRRRVEALFTAQRMADDVDSMYQRLLSTPLYQRRRRRQQ